MKKEKSIRQRYLDVQSIYKGFLHYKSLKKGLEDFDNPSKDMLKTIENLKIRIKETEALLNKLLPDID